MSLNDEIRGAQVRAGEQVVVDRLRATEIIGDVAAEHKDPFLAAWKRGVLLAGARYFTCDRAYLPAANVKAATSKWQLVPKWEYVENFIKTRGASQWERAFLAAMCSFYNDEWGTEMMRRLGVNSPGQLAIGLDGDRRQVIAALLVTYRGW